MFIQYLKIAWRNLIKFRTQSIISIVGLAIGFTAFAFTLSWIRYEKTYDNFNPAANRIFKVYEVTEFSEVESKPSAPTALADYLMKNFPEMEAATIIMRDQNTYDADNPNKSKWMRFLNDCEYVVYADTNFFKVFSPETKIKYPKIIHENAKIISRSMAKKWNITNNDIGRKLDSLANSIPIAIVDDNPVHSNVHFNLMFMFTPGPNWNSDGTETFIRIREGADLAKFEQKLKKIKTKGIVSRYSPNRAIAKEETIEKSFKLVPLSTLHYTYPHKSTAIKLNYLEYFSIVALLVIICALLNYLMLFVNRIKIRSRELALRKVNGASESQLLHLLLVEFIVVLILSLFLGGMLTEILFPVFVKFSLITAPKAYFMWSVLGYSLLLISTVGIITYVVLYYFMKRGLKENIQPELKKYRLTKNQFALGSVIVQLIISILLVFSTVVVFQQYHLLSQGVGFDRNNLICIEGYGEEIPISELKNLNGVVDAAPNLQQLFFGVMYKINEYPNLKVTDKSQHTQLIEMKPLKVDSSFCRFLKIPILEGRNMIPSDKSVCLINEAAKLKIGHDAVGKTIEGKRIIGVIPDLYIESPMLPVRPVMYTLTTSLNPKTCSSFILRYSTKPNAKVFIPFWKRHPNYNFNGGADLNQQYEDYSRSERNLLILLSIMTMVALLISIFGVYSMISLTCGQRRKEIAIRKVNGAKATNILYLIIKQYFVVVILSCIVAFPLGVLIMQRWLEHYPHKTSLEWWVFVGIFLLISLIVLLSVISRIIKTAKENPAEVVKGEIN